MKVTSLILCLLVGYVSSKPTCDLPPSEWCSTPETAKLCQVTEECEKIHNGPSEVPKVKISLYYESLCPFSVSFITGQLNKAYQSVSSIMDVELIPFGNAKIKTANGQTSFTCQHGPLECQANLLETCATKMLPESDVFPYIYCISKEIQHGSFPYFAYKVCAQQLKTNVKPLFACSMSEQGMAFEKVMQAKTNSLNPRKTYVPWVLVNGVHTEDLQNQAQSDLVGLVCKLYKGTVKPAVCNKY